VVVFPELSLTGYELDARAVAINDAALAPIVNACAATGSLALAGAPVQYEDGRDDIAVLAIGGGGASVAYRKTWLGCAEPARFRPGDGSAVLEVDGWRLGLGVRKDTGAAQHVAGTAALGVDAYLGGLVHLPQELPRAGGPGCGPRAGVPRIRGLRQLRPARPAGLRRDRRVLRRLLARRHRYCPRRPRLSAASPAPP